MEFGDSKERGQNAGSMGGEAQARDFRRARLRTEQEPQGSFGPRAAENEGGGAGDTAAENGVGANFNVNDERASRPSHHQVHPHVVIAAPPPASAPAAAARVDAPLESGTGPGEMDARHDVRDDELIVRGEVQFRVPLQQLAQQQFVQQLAQQLAQQHFVQQLAQQLVQQLLQPQLLLALQQQPPPQPSTQPRLPHPHLNRTNDGDVPPAPAVPGPSPREARSEKVSGPVGSLVVASPATCGSNSLEVRDRSSTTTKTGRTGGGYSSPGSSAASSGDGAAIHLATREGSSSTTKKGPPGGGSSPPGANEASPSDGAAIHPAAREGSSSTIKKGPPGGSSSPPGANEASPSDGAAVHPAAREGSSSTTKKGPPGGSSLPPGANGASPSDGAAIHPAARDSTSPTTKTGQPGRGSSSPRADAASVGSGAPIHRRAAMPAPTANGGRDFEKSQRETPAFRDEGTISDSPPTTPVDIRSRVLVAHRSPTTELQRKRPASSAALSSLDSQRQLIHSFASGSVKSFDASASASTPKRPKTISNAMRSWGSEQIEGKQKRQLAGGDMGPSRPRGPTGAGAKTSTSTTTAGAATAPPPRNSAPDQVDEGCRTKLLNGANVQSGSRTQQRKSDVESFDSPFQYHGPQMLYPEGTRLAHWFIDESGTYRPYWGEVYGVDLDSINGVATYRVAYDDGSADEWTEEAIPDGLAYAAKIKGGIPADAEKRLKAAVEKARDELSRIMAQEGSQGTPASVASIRSAHDVSFTERESRRGATVAEEKSVEQTQASIATVPSEANHVPPSEPFRGKLNEAPDLGTAFASVAATKLETHGSSPSRRCSHCELFGTLLFGELGEHKVSLVIDASPESQLREGGGLFSCSQRDADDLERSNHVRVELSLLVDKGKVRLVSKCGVYDSKMPKGCLHGSTLRPGFGMATTLFCTSSFEHPIRFEFRMKFCPKCRRLVWLSLSGKLDPIFSEQELHSILQGKTWSVLDGLDYDRAKSILDPAGEKFAEDGAHTTVRGRTTVLGAINGNLAALHAASLSAFQKRRRVVQLGNIYSQHDDCPFQLSLPLSLALRKLHDPEGFYVVRGRYETRSGDSDVDYRVSLRNAFRRTYGDEWKAWFQLLETTLHDNLPYGISVVAAVGGATTSADVKGDSFLCVHSGIPLDGKNSDPKLWNEIPQDGRAKELFGVARNDTLKPTDAAGKKLEKCLKEISVKSLVRCKMSEGLKWKDGLLSVGPATCGIFLNLGDDLKPTKGRV